MISDNSYMRSSYLKDRESSVVENGVQNLLLHAPLNVETDLSVRPGPSTEIVIGMSGSQPTKVEGRHTGPPLRKKGQDYS